MAKRYTDTEKWGRAWFRKLSPTMKCAWNFVCDKCDHAGFWDIDWESMRFFIGANVSPEDFEAAFKGRVLKFEQSSKYLLIGFVSFQYLSPKSKEKELNPKNTVHQSVISILKTHAPWIAPSKLLSYPLITPSELLESPCQGDKDKEEEEDTYKDKDEVKEKEEGFDANQARQDMASLDGIKSIDGLIDFWNTSFASQGYPFAPFSLGDEYTKKFFKINKRLLQNKSSWDQYLAMINESKFLTTIKEGGKPAIVWVLEESNFDDVFAGKYKNRKDKIEAALDDLELQ